jgi:catechol 2,3-dioxygenase-like lactoylglutathione lyase family enzyme
VAISSFLYTVGSKREEWSDFRATSEHSAPRVSTGTDVPGKNRFSSDILLLKGVHDVFCRATDSGRSYTHYYGNDTAHKLEKEKMMKVLFVAGFGPIVSDRQESVAFYRESLGLSFQEEADGYFHTEDLQGVNTFALWPLSQVAQSCFGVNEWPADLPAPTSWLEFDVEDVAEASEELQAKGYTLLIAVKKEPWGQTVTRLLSPEGILVGLTYTPVMRESEVESQ